MVGSAISPVIKVCANPETFQQLQDTMDIDSGRILYCQAELAKIRDGIVQKVLETAQGMHTKSESLLHHEFIITYKSFNPFGAACLPIPQSP